MTSKFYPTRRKFNFDHRGKVNGDNDSPGFLEGYASAYGNIDLGNERIMHGAFTKSIRERVTAKRVALMSDHFLYGGDIKDAVGLVEEASEDNYGLFIKAKFSKVQSAQDIRTKLLEGIGWGLSVGCRVLRWDETSENGKTIFNIYEASLDEVTVTLRPMNEAAIITSAKSILDAKEKFGELPLSKSELIELRNLVDNSLQQFNSSPEIIEQSISDEDIELAKMTLELLKLKVR